VDETSPPAGELSGDLRKATITASLAHPAASDVDIRT